MSSELIATETIALFQMLGWAEKIAEEGYGKVEIKDNQRVVLYLNRNLTDTFSVFPWGGFPRIIVPAGLVDLFCAVPWDKAKLTLSESTLALHAGVTSEGVSTFVLIFPLDASLNKFFKKSSILALTANNVDKMRYIGLLVEKENAAI